MKYTFFYISHAEIMGLNIDRVIKIRLLTKLNRRYDHANNSGWHFINKRNMHDGVVYRIPFMSNRITYQGEDIIEIHKDREYLLMLDSLKVIATFRENLININYRMERICT